MKAIVKAEDIMAAQTQVGKDKVHPILNGVHIEVVGKRASVVGVDGFRMVVAESEHEENEEGSVTLDLSSIKLKKRDYITIESADGDVATVSSLLESTSTQCRVIEGKFPDWRALLPESGKDEAIAVTHRGFNPSYMSDLGKAYRTWLGNSKANVCIEFMGEQGLMVLIKEIGDRSFFGLVMPLRESETALKQPKASKRSKASKGADDKLKASYDALCKDFNDATVKNHELEAEIDRLKGEMEELKAEHASKPEADELQSKIDALIAEHETIAIAGTTSCAVYFEPTIAKGSEEMEAIRAAGGKFGNHKKFGKCWYMPR